MPRYSELTPLDPDEEYRKRSIHWNRKEWNQMLEVAKDLRLNDLSSVVKESIRLARLHLHLKKELITSLKEKIAAFNLKARDLFDVND